MSLGGLAIAVGIGAALSNAVARAVAQKAGFGISFLVLGAIALIAFLVLFIFVPEMLQSSSKAPRRPVDDVAVWNETDLRKAHPRDHAA